MSLELANRVSGYLTLALAAACLACADATFVPALPLLLVPALVLLVVAFVAEGRGWVLPAWAANIAGALIVASVGGAVAAYTLRSPTGLSDELPLALLLLPWTGPLLLALALVKLFRPKTGSDAWALQGLGLLMTALACVLADGGLFGVLLLAYLVCGTWHLTLAYLRREELRAAAPAAAPSKVPWRALGVSRGACWALAAAALALPAFLLAPRGGDSPWDPFLLLGPRANRARARGDVGLGSGIDLNRTETLDPTDEVAVRVEAFRDRELTVPKTDLSADQRWRGRTLDSYQNGRWEQGRIALAGLGTPAEMMRSPRVVDMPGMPPRELPDLGPGQFYLRFTTLPKVAGDLVLAEPAVVRDHTLPAMPAPSESRMRLLFQETLGVIVPLKQSADRAEIHYLQVVPATTDANLSDPVVLIPRYLELMLRQPVAPLEPWTRDLAGRLAERPDSNLRGDDLEPAPVPGVGFGPRQPERVARALSAYLAWSGDYTYSFVQERADTNLDPTLDFLVNVRHGPCTRFASALALMLRSLGVPARVVLGFRGCERLDNGRCQVLSSQAHAWVEVLVERPGPDGAARWHWLTLDPTPSSDAVPRPSFSLLRWLDGHYADVPALWRSYVVEYDPSRQETEVLMPLREYLDQVWAYHPAAPAGGLALGIGLATAGLGAVYLLRRRRRPPVRRVVRVGFYSRLLEVLARVHGLLPRPAQTPREFASEAGRVLLGKGIEARVADVPARVAELFYRVAFGGRPLSDDEAREIDGRLDALAAAR
jgi:hypothetical protein